MEGSRKHWSVIDAAPINGKDAHESILRKLPLFFMFGSDSFPVAAEKDLTRAHYKKGISNFFASFPTHPAIFTMTSFVPSLSSPLNNKYVGLGTSLCLGSSSMTMLPNHKYLCY